MDIRVLKISSIILGSLLLLSIILLTFFGIRLANINNIKSAEMNSNMKKREDEIKKICQLDKERLLTTYTSDEVFGNFQFSFPKAWSTNVRQTDSDPELQYLADPETILMTNETGPATGLRVMVFKEKFTSLSKEYETKSNGSVTAFSFEDITLSGLKGKKFVGSTNETAGKKISFVLLPLREKTLYIGTDNVETYSEQFASILKSFKISR